MTTRHLQPALGALAILAVASPIGAQVPVGGEFQVNTVTTGAQNSPSVAMGSGGDFVVVWQSRDLLGAFDQIRGQRFSSEGVLLGSEFLVNSDTSEDQFWPDVAPAENGDFVVVWASDYRIGQSTDVLGRRFESSGRPIGTEFRVNSFTTFSQTSPSVAADTEGNFVVVWSSFLQDGSGEGIFGQRFDAEGGRVGEEFQVNTVTAGTQFRPEVAASASGAFVVVWTSRLAPPFRVAGQRFDAGGEPAGGEFEVNSTLSHDQVGPDVAMDDEGEFVVVWTQYDRLHPVWSRVLAQRYDAFGVALGIPFEIDSSKLPLPNLYSVASDPDGDSVVTWVEIVDGANIFAGEFDAAGNARTGEFRVNTHGTGVHAYPSVASDTDGNFVVVWESREQDGSDSGVFGQRYAGPGLHLGADGSCPGPVSVSVAQAPPGSEVAVIAAGNENGSVKGGSLCAGTRLEIGEPFALPPSFVVVDSEGSGSIEVELPKESCFLEALALADCSTSGGVRVMPAE